MSPVMAKQAPKSTTSGIGFPSLWRHARMVSSWKRTRIMDTDKERKLQGASNVIDVIDAVAHVNNCLSDDKISLATPSFLPELRTSPCPIYHRKHQTHHLTLHQQQQMQRPDDRNDLLYSTSCHGGTRTTRSVAARVSPKSMPQDESKLQAERDLIFQRNMEAGKSKTWTQPELPKESIKPEDFVNTWLQYGSQIHGSHFPDIMSNKSHHIAHTVLCKSGKKQILSPIQTRKTRKFCSKTSVLSDL